MNLRRPLLGVLLPLLAASPHALADDAARLSNADPPKKATPKRPAPKRGPAAGKNAPKPKAYSLEVMVLHANNSDKGIDPRIGPMPELSKPPFSAYKSYAFLQKVKQPLVVGKPKTLELPNERVLKTALLAELPKGSVKISASINEPGGKTFLPLLEVKARVGQAFIVAGQAYKGGILVLVVRVVT